MYIRNKKIGNGSYYIIEDRIKVNGKLKTINVRYLGTAKNLLANLEKLDELENKAKIS
ncbi:MAG: hypothetical protein KJ598_00705 [Nanoarchaeota archaeon]|nr:hypothetical protein [Nanoarchaeota archaeon]